MYWFSNYISKDNKPPHINLSSKEKKEIPESSEKNNVNHNHDSFIF